MLIEKEDKWVLIMWVNEIDYNGYKVNVIRQISKDKKTGKDSVWMWITNRKITEKNVLKIIACAKARDYIENQGFREQKVTSGIDFERKYSNLKSLVLLRYEKYKFKTLKFLKNFFIFVITEFFFISCYMENFCGIIQLIK